MGCNVLRQAAVLSLLAVGGAVAVAQDTPQPDASPPEITRLTHTYYPKFFLRYAPDGSHIVYSRHYRNLRGTNQILVGLRLVGADGTDDRPLLPEFDAQVQIQEHACWSPDGTQLVLSGGGNDTGNSAKDTFLCDVDRDFRATGLRKLIPGQSVMVGEEPCFSPDGKQLAFVSISEQLWIVDVDGTNKTLVVHLDGQYCHQPAWSPNGRWIAFASDRDGNIELYKVRSDGAELTRLTDQPRIDCRPRWSRDGEWILFTSNRNGNYDLYAMRSDGSDLRQLTTHSAMDDHADWSPDGTSIAFVSFRDGGFDIYRMTLPANIKIGPAPPLDSSEPSTAAIDGLIAHYDFDDQSGPAARDRVAGLPIALSGATIVRDDGRGSLAFDGQDDSAVLGNAARIRMAGPLTLSVWVRPASTGRNGYLISKHGWNLYLGSDLVPRFETRTADDSAWDTLAASAPLRPDEWSFVTAVFDPGREKLLLYVNGKLSAERPRRDGAIAAVTHFSLDLGHYTVSKTQNFHGGIDELRLYHRPLDGDEIARQFAQQAARVTGSDSGSR